MCGEHGGAGWLAAGVLLASWGSVAAPASWRGCGQLGTRAYDALRWLRLLERLRCTQLLCLWRLAVWALAPALGTLRSSMQLQRHQSTEVSADQGLISGRLKLKLNCWGGTHFHYIFISFFTAYIYRIGIPISYLCK